MIQIAGGLSALPALTVALAAFEENWSFGIAETLTAVALIIAFGIAAAVYTIRHDV
jgi:hypothetical protein